MLNITKNKFYLSSALSLFLLSANTQLIAATFSVNNNDDISDINPGDGVCETNITNGICTFRAALDETNALNGADIINLPADTFTIQTSASYSNNSGSFFIADEVDIIGQSASTTIIDANNLDRAMVVLTPGIVNISNVTLKNGNVGASGVGGGLAAGNSSLQLTISNSVIQSNQAGTGGGLGTGSPVQSITLENCLIENNIGIETPDRTSWGGGISFSTGLLTISKTTIRNNISSFGGGLTTIGDIVLLESSVIENTSTLTENVNNGYGGGGLQIGSGSAGSLISINSTISGNKAYTSGAGLLVVNGTVHLYNTTITNNTADSNNDLTGYGGGVIASNSQPSPNIFLSNTIIANNNGGQNSPDCSDFNINITSQGYNLIGKNTDCNFSAGTGDLIGTAAEPVEPLLEVLADNGGSTLTHALMVGSPAIDAANPSGCFDNSGNLIVADQRAGERHVDGGAGSNRCDIGAFEIDYVLKVNAGSNQSVVQGSVVSLDASGSESSFGIASYTWLQTSGPAITLGDVNSATTNFIAPSTASTIRLELTIVDNNGNNSQRYSKHSSGK